MGHPFGTGFLVVNALFFVITTYVSGTAPARFAGALGLAIANPGGANEVRGQYAGFFLAVAAVCAAAAAGLAPRQAVFLVLAVLFGGLTAGRLLSLILNRGTAGYGPTIRALCAIDALGPALTMTAMAVDRAG